MGMSGIERALVGLLTLAVIASAIAWMGKDRLRYRRLIFATLITTLVLVVLGAYVRLSDAGLGCPDWPGCYGSLTPHHSVEEIRAAELLQPGGPVSMAKAWKEMLHRYLAMIVGALIAAIGFSAWRNRRNFSQSPLLAIGLVALVLFQALLGAWTVTMLLKPAIVTAHLLGGMALLALLTWLHMRQAVVAYQMPLGSIIPSGLRIFAIIGLLSVFIQIALGGWVSTNYAALACEDFPTCNGALIPAMSFGDAFHIIRPLGFGPDGQLITIEALRAIHWTHRVGALLVSAILLALALALWRRPALKRRAGSLVALLTLQVLLGVANVVWSLPLVIAIAHNGAAALLLAYLVYINFSLSR